MTSTTIPPEDEAIEEVARAINDAQVDEFWWEDRWIDMPEADKPAFRRIAQAAIAALQSRRSQPDSDREAIIEVCEQMAAQVGRQFCSGDGYVMGGPAAIVATICGALRALKHSGTMRGK